jgi:hypothetical protein
MAFDFTAATARHANSRSSSSASVGFRFVGTVQPSVSMIVGARSCTSTPPRTRL